MRELLGKLKTLDRACYDEIWTWALWLEEDGSYKPDNLEWMRHKDDVIQGACQRAIEKRGLIWTVTKEDSNSEEAIAGTPYQAIVFTNEIDVLVDNIFEDSPAKAILAAYLAAIEARP